MTQETLLLMLNKRHFSPTIINTADATHYLIGAEDNMGNFYRLEDSNQNALLTRSLEEAKFLLKSLGINQAFFEMRTPYDEMIGTECETNSRTRYEIYF